MGARRRRCVRASPDFPKPPLAGGTLHLRPASAAYATQLRLFEEQMITRINHKTGRTSVRRSATDPAARRNDRRERTGRGEAPDDAPAPQEPGPARPQVDGCPGHQQALATHRPAKQRHRPTRRSGPPRNGTSAIRPGNPKNSSHTAAPQPTNSGARPPRRTPSKSAAPMSCSAWQPNGPA
ncbi:DciA family protein [Streptomyces sp. NPDC050617]|uniref:DciA family protein n=1 Tax=Streptomyces sp. NPDC050617 TaxID=3154628 RepID=UPI003443C6EC